MIGYVTLGTNDMERGAVFYDELLQILGAKRLWNTDRFIAWGTSPKSPSIALAKPFDGEAATVGNGVMVAIAAASPEQVDQLHAAALKAGGTDEGAPGPRGSGFYGGYFRDLDGNKLNAFCFVAAPSA